MALVDSDRVPAQFSMTFPSPRTELLSPTSQPQALPGELDRVRHSQRGPSEGYRRQREQAYANFSSRQILHLLIEKEHESGKLRKALHKIFDRLDAEDRRATEAERVTQEALNQLRVVNGAKLAAERALSKAHEELGLWKYQFERAQNEITRAQDVVRLVEGQRDDAENAASEARKTARQLYEQRLVSDALEEGKRLGYEAGFRRAQQELAVTRPTTAGNTYDYEHELEDSQAYSAFQPQNIDRTSEPQTARHVDTSPMPLNPSPEPIHVRRTPPTQAPPTRESPSPPMPVPMAMPSPERAFVPEALLQHPPPAPSPSIQLSRYEIEIPSPSEFNDPPANYPPQRRPSQPQEPQHQREVFLYRDMPPAEHNAYRRPSSQARPRSVSASRPPEQRTHRPPPDNYIPSVDADGGIALPPPFQLSPNPSVRPLSPIAREEQQHRDDAARPPSQAHSHSQRPRSVSASRPQEQPAYRPPPDNYIPSVDPGGGIALPPPFQLSPHPSMRPLSPTEAPRPRQSWYNRDQEQQQQQQAPQGQPQSWYQVKRPRSNAGSAAGSVAGRSAVGSIAGRSAQGRHARQASLDSRLSAKNQKLAAGEYATDLGAIREDARSLRSGRSGQGYGERELPPPLPPKDERHRKQVIADGLRYSDPDMAEHWRRDAAAASQSRPPRNVREPAVLTFPSPLSPQNKPAPLAVPMRAKTVSGSTVMSGTTQKEAPILRRISQRRPISPSDIGSPDFGTIRVQPPSQSSSQIPSSLASPAPQMDQYLGPNYQTQPFPNPHAPASPVSQGGFHPPSGFQPQSFTMPAQITVPVTFKGKSISSPVTFPANGNGHDNGYSGAPNRPVSSFGGSNASPGRPRAASLNAEDRPPSRAGSHVSRKSRKPDDAGMLTAGHGLERQASNASLRSTSSSYARFNPETYHDPAYFAADTSAGAIPVPAPAPRSRRASVSTHHSNHSSLSYIGPPGHGRA
ncbi:hypothetical protein DFH06DRAFT_1385547 [Mycena polygramma]|nr:hypothetical protein DFH06DRAFT_1385547 [Mycena polygramma]